MFVYDKDGKEAVGIGSSPEGNTVDFMSPHTGKKAMMFSAKDDLNTLILADEKGEIATVLHGKSGDNYLGVRTPLGKLHKYTGSGTVRTTVIPRNK